MSGDLLPGLRKREAWLTGLLSFGVAAAVAMAGYHIALMTFLHWSETGAFATAAQQDDFATLVDLAGGLIGAAYLVFLICSAVCYGYWVNRAVRVAALRAPNIMTISPGWAFGWNFIPIAALWMPFRAVAQAWRAGGNSAQETLPGAFYLWWLPWLGSNMIAQATFRLAGGFNPTFEQLKLSSQLDLVSDVLMMLACIGLIRVVGHVGRRLGEPDQDRVAVFE